MYVSDRIIPTNKLVDYMIDGFPELTPALCRFSDGPLTFSHSVLLNITIDTCT